MENKENILDQFLGDDTQKKTRKAKKSGKEVVLKEREGLIERVDKKFITEDGRQLLREQY